MDEINAQFTTSFPGAAVVIHSADQIDAASDGLAPDNEFLNSIELSNFPAHQLTLKKYMPLMLLRNLAPSDGICNGTRLVLLEIVSHDLLQCMIATGKHAGDIVFINRIRLTADKDAFPFDWSRLQFPVGRRPTPLAAPCCNASRSRPLHALLLCANQVRPAFAMTINKAQGQTLQRVGVYLQRPCFAHGQLYVAASRVGLPAHLRFAVPLDAATGTFRTRNIVYREVLTS